MDPSFSNRYCIAGIGHTRYGALPDTSVENLHVQAIQQAVADAGLTKYDIDGVLCLAPVSNFQIGYAVKLSGLLGITPRILGALDQEGASIITLIGYAMMAIDAKQCSVAVISYADNPRSGSRAIYGAPRGTDGIFGWFGTPAAYAMIARAHMEEYGTRAEQLGSVVVACRKHAQLTEHAERHREFSMEQYLSQPMLVDPFRPADCALVSDGGAALIVTSLAHCQSLGIRDPIRILGIGQGHQPQDLSHRQKLTTSGAVASGRQAFAMAGLGTSDIDVAELYDCFSITVPITLEDYGFCDKGEGGPFVENGRIEIGGTLPMNTAGGLLAETGLPGPQLVIEAVRQMRGNCGERQIMDAKVALVSNQGGIMQTHSTLILGR